MYFSLALIFIAVLVVGAAYCLFWRKALLINGEEQKSAQYGNRVVFWILLGAALLLCVLASCLLPHHIDLDYYNEWGMYLKRNGPASFYADFPSDYPPLFLYFCTALSWFSDISGIQYAIVYRLFFTLVYVASVLVVCKIAKELGGVKGQAIPLVYAFTPAVMADGSAWGQSDVFVVLFALLLWYFLYKEKWLVFFGVLLLALLIKTQIVLFAPVVAVWLVYKMVKNKLYWKFVLYALACIVLFYLMYLPFGIEYIRAGEYFYFIHLFVGQVTHYTWYSANAMNFWAAIGLNLTEAPPAVMYVSYALVAALSAALAVLVIRSKHEDRLLIACIMQLVIVCTFCVSMHERYLLPTVPLLLLLCAKNQDKRLHLYAAAMVSMQFINIVFAWIYKGNGWFDAIQGLYIALSVLFVVVIVLYCCKTVRMLLAGRMHTEESDQTVVQDQVCSEDALKE